MSDNKRTLAMIGRAVLPAGLLLLSACGAFSGAEDPPPCPAVSVLPVAAEITRFSDGPGRDLIDIDFQGRIDNLSGKCLYDVDSESGEGLVRVMVSTEFTINRGAANKTRRADFEYFVAKIDDRGEVLEKQVFPYTATYWKNRMSVKDYDGPVEVEIALTDGRRGDDYSIFVGFQLSERELQYNRRQSGL